MSDKNKKDPIEQLFQEKAEKYNISYHEEDWLKLEGRLDNLDKQHANRKKRWAVAAAVLLVFSLLAYSNYQNYLKINELTEKLNNQQITTTPSDNIPSDSDHVTDSQDPESENEDIATSDAPKNQNTNDTSPGSTSEEDQQQANAERGTTVADPTVGDRGSNNYLAANSFTRTSPRTEPACPECNLAESQNMLQPTVEDLVKSGGSKPIRKTSDAIAAMHPPVDSRNQLMQRHPSRITLGLSMAPDMSTVGSISNFQNPGYKFGFSIEYNLTQNLGLSIGAIHSTVNYVASGQEYNPGIYWKDGIRPDEAIAQCVLIDIPVSLKYNFAHFDHSRLYGTAGLSTYIMLNEDYQFKYQSYDSDLIQNWSGRTGTSYWMSNAGVSIGYELDINPNFSIRAEPFIKVPLREVGWGNVKLYSLGSFLSINYKIQTSK